MRGFLCFKEDDDDDDEDYRGVQNYNVPEQDRLRQVKLFFIKKRINFRFNIFSSKEKQYDQTIVITVQIHTERLETLQLLH